MTGTGSVLSFFRPRQSVDRDWTQEELAQFYRVEAALIRSGLLIDVDRGISDEGDPWFIFCRQDNGEVVGHFARIRDQYVIASSAFPGVARGKDFNLLISDLMRSSPLPVPREIRQAQNIYLHPAAMLVALLATAFMVTSESDGHDQHASHSLGKDVLRLLSLGEFAILSAVAIATTWVEYQIDSGLKLLEAELSAEANTNAGGHPHAISEVVTVVQNLFKIDSDFGAHKVSADAPSLSLDNQHQADSSIPGHTVAGAMASPQTSMEKIFDLSISLSNPGSPADSGHGATASLPGPDNLTPIQTVGPEAPNVVSQVDHSASLPQSMAQAVVAPVQIPASSTSTDAYHALATDLTGSNLSVSVVSAGNLSLESSLQKVLTNLQSGNQQVAQAQAIAPTTATTTTANPAPDAHSSSSPPAFDAHANTILQDFMSTNQNVEEDLAGQHVIVVDKTPGDIADTHFGSLSWTFDDGSTLTIVGILPSSAHAGVHASG
jgi:hypothetical protein